MRGNPSTGQILPRFGTPVLVNANNALGVFGSRNWQRETFEGAEGLSRRDHARKDSGAGQILLCLPHQVRQIQRGGLHGPYKGARWKARNMKTSSPWDPCAALTP